MQEEQTPKKRFRRKRAKATINVEGLPDRSAPDRPKETVTITVRLRVADKEFLDGLGQRSYHARQAVEGYVAEFERLQAIAERLGVLPGEAIAECIRAYQQD